MPFVEHSGVRTHFVQLSSGLDAEAEDLIMIHGLGTSLSYWYSPSAIGLANSFRVTLYDLPGHGRSGVPLSGYTPSALSNGLGKLMDSLGIDRAHLIAHSYGGVVALGMACSRPERIIDLVLADTQIAAFRSLGQDQAAASASRLQELLSLHGIVIDVNDRYFGMHLLSAVARLQVGESELTPELVQLLGPVLGKSSKSTARRWLQLLELTNAGEELMSDDGLGPESLTKLRIPILAMYGERSRCRSAGQRLVSFLPRGEFSIVPDAGHFFPTTHPLILMGACTRFYEERNLLPDAT